jgi:hypothetical protein
LLEEIEVAEELFEVGVKVILEKTTGRRSRKIIYGAVFYGEPVGDEHLEFFEPSSSIEGWLDGRSMSLDREDIERTEAGHIKFSFMGDDFVIRPMEASDDVVEQRGGILLERTVDEEEDDELEALLDPVSRRVKYLMRFTNGAGDFQRRGGRWIPLVEEEEGEFEDIPIILLDPRRSGPLIEKWDVGGLTETDLRDYILDED